MLCLCAKWRVARSKRWKSHLTSTTRNSRCLDTVYICGRRAIRRGSDFCPALPVERYTPMLVAIQHIGFETSSGLSSILTLDAPIFYRLYRRKHFRRNGQNLSNIRGDRGCSAYAADYRIDLLLSFSPLLTVLTCCKTARYAASLFSRSAASI